MKWAYSIREKSKAAFLLAIILFAVSVVTWMDKHNVSQLGNSFSSVYEDRLVVESYIYKFSDYLYQKKIMLDNCNSSIQLDQLRTTIHAHNEAIGRMIASYEQTKLTRSEEAYFKAFKINIDQIMRSESALINASDQRIAEKISFIDHHVDQALLNLNHLSGIQLEEGKALNENSKKIMAGSSLLTQFELVLLIIVGVFIQILIFTSRSLNPRIPQNHELN